MADTPSEATRTETDSIGPVEVPTQHLWGAQTQRCLINFPIGTERLPVPFIRALGMQKRAAAAANNALGLLDDRVAGAIMSAAEEVSTGLLDDEFPLPVWQTGSGTQSNMNANEVIANRATEMLGGTRGDKSVVHPNDHVNMGQSSNDTIPTAMLIASAIMTERVLKPALESMASSLGAFRAYAGRDAHHAGSGFLGVSGAG